MTQETDLLLDIVRLLKSSIEYLEKTGHDVVIQNPDTGEFLRVTDPEFLKFLDELEITYVKPEGGTQ